MSCFSLTFLKYSRQVLLNLVEFKLNTEALVLKKDSVPQLSTFKASNLTMSRDSEPDLTELNWTKSLFTTKASLIGVLKIRQKQFYYTEYIISKILIVSRFYPDFIQNVE